MPFFLESCRKNPDIDWFFFSDCGMPEFVPDNVRIQTTSFKDYCAFVAQRLNISFVPENPYKLCDLKPALGFIHADQLQNCDFWAFGDIDLIYGQLRDYFTDARLTRYDLLSTHARRISGHLCLIRNTPHMNTLFRHIPNWQNLCSNMKHQHLDESAFSRLFIKHKNFPKPLFDLFGKLNPLRRTSDFTEAYSTPGMSVPWTDGTKNFPQYWFWRDGHLTTDRDGAREFPYFHFLYWKKYAWQSLFLSTENSYELIRQSSWRISADGFESLPGFRIPHTLVRAS
jgi:hypothetical protein